jgi:hypothetical protein
VVRFPAGTTNTSLLHSAQIGSEAYPTSYPMGTEGSLFGDETADL